MITRDAAADKEKAEDPVPTQRVADGIGSLEAVPAKGAPPDAPVEFKLSLPDGSQIISHMDR